LKTLIGLVVTLGLMLSAAPAASGAQLDQVAPPAAFGKLSPPDGSNQPTTVTIAWQESAGATSYEYCVRWIVMSWCIGTDWVSVGTATSATVQVAQPGGFSVHNWQVRARNANGLVEADGGALWRFSAYRPPAPFSKLGPTSGAITTTSPTLSWGFHADAGPYDYCLDTSDNSNCDTTWVSVGSSIIRSVTLSGLTPGKTYYWQVRSRYPAGAVEANAGTWWHFTTSLVTNGGFTDGLAGWSVFGHPNPDDMIWNVVDGVFEFYRAAPSPGSPNQAVVFHATGQALPATASLRAQFDLGNSSAVRKRISILLHDADFSDLSVCTFWLAPGAPLTTYQMQTHPTKDWTNATASFYAASIGSDAGYYRLDNVLVYPEAAGPTAETECVDPTAPDASTDPDGTGLLVNGDFSQGLSGWGLFGQIVQQTVGGVFEFYRPAGTPAGVILQRTGVAMAAGSILTASLDLGNSSDVRKRVTILICDADFSDLAACTFWLAPGQPLSPYAVRMFTSKEWANATLSVYAATIGTDEWIRLDNVSLRRTPAASTAGTTCLEPVETAAREVGPSKAVQPFAPSTPPSAGGIATQALEGVLPSMDALAVLEFSRDGESWTPVALIPATVDWSWVLARLAIDPVWSSDETTVQWRIRPVFTRRR
jgi:hypothetical protein